MNEDTNNDLVLLSLFSSRDKWERYHQFINNDVLSDKAGQIFKDLKDWYANFDTYDHVEWDSFSSWFKLVKHSHFKEDKIKLFDRMFSKIPQVKIDESLELEIINTFIKREYMTKIADISLRGAEGEEVEIDEIEELTKEFHVSVGRIEIQDNSIISDDMGELASYIEGSGGLYWRLDSFNKSLGPLRKGDLGAISATPETGKTTILSSEGSFMANQLKDGEHLLWFNNEEDGHKVKFRFIQAALGWDTKYLKNMIKYDPNTVLQEYDKAVRGRDKIKIIDKADMRVNHVEDIIDKYPPGMIIFDQLYKIGGFERDAGNDVGRLGALAAWARDLAKTYSPVIFVHQARGDATGVLYPTANQMYGSQTVMQGELDFQLMLGRSFDTGFENVRGINICKNKLLGDDSTDPSLRHAKIQIIIDPDKARFIDAPDGYDTIE